MNIVHWETVERHIVEVSPPFDPSGNTAIVGATMMFEILCVLAEARSRRGQRSR